MGCTASLLSATLQSRVAHVDVRHGVYASLDVTWQVGSCSLQAMAIKPCSDSSVCHERESRTADDSDDRAVTLDPSVGRQGSRLHDTRLPRSLVGRLSPKEGFETPKQGEGVIGPSPLGKFRQFECRKTQTGKREGGTDRTTH